MMDALVFGGILFWILAAVEIFALFCFVANDFAFGALVSLFIFGSILNFASGIPILQYLVDHPLNIVLGFFGYFVAGAIWMIARWTIFVKNIFNSTKEDFIRQYGKITEVNNDKWIAYAKGFAPQTYYNKEKLLNWCTFWPISLIWYCIHNIVHDIAQWIYNQFSGFLQKISDRIFFGGK